MVRDMTNKMITITMVYTMAKDDEMCFEAMPNQTLLEVFNSHIKIRDGTSFEIFDHFGNVISENIANDYRNQVVYFSPKRICGGGIPRDRLKELKIEYPSLRPVKQHLSRREAQMFKVRFPSENRTKSGFWEIVIYCPNASSSLMHAYVLNFNEIIRQPSVSLFANPPSTSYGQGSGNGTIPGSKRRARWVCHGNILPHLNQLGSDPIIRVGAYLNHIQNLLNQ
tara:strand:+ start:828 stop:1499 length:672 start_codon:yes stop_codon:yes gene_type:complete